MNEKVNPRTIQHGVHAMAPTAIAVRRIQADVRRVRTELEETGIFWISEETNITMGWACIGGLEGTPYHGGIFVFEVQFPDNYPFAPPKFKYLTNDGRTRFNPNLYITGKVCLSLLNTWAGEQWSAIQSLASILQCIQSVVLVADPLHNEPAYVNLQGHEDVPVYNRMVTHAVVKTAILDQLRSPLPCMLPILPQLKAFVARQRPVVLQTCRSLAEEWENTTERLEFFRMQMRYGFHALADDLATFDLS